MKRLLFLFFVSSILFSCSNNKKSIYDLEQESLATGERNDTIFGDFVFGMTREELSVINKANYRFQTEELRKYDFVAYPQFYNDSLMEMRFTAYNSVNAVGKYSLDPIVNLFSLKYNKPDTVYTDKRDGNLSYHNVWLKGNLKIEVKYSEQKYLGLSITYTDLSRNFYGEKIIYGEGEDMGNVYTKDYYENVFLPRKKDNIKNADF